MPCQKRIIAGLPLLLLPLLQACQTVEAQPQLPTLNASMFRCSPSPDVPTKERLSEDDGDTALGIYITRLDLAHSDCEETLGEARTTLEIMGLTVTDTAVTAQKEPKRDWWPF